MNCHADREKGSEGRNDARACAGFLAIPLNRGPASCGGAPWPPQAPSLTISEPPRLVMLGSEGVNGEQGAPVMVRGAASSAPSPSTPFRNLLRPPPTDNLRRLQAPKSNQKETSYDQNETARHPGRTCARR